jgi:hypothetical protein
VLAFVVAEQGDGVVLRAEKFDHLGSLRTAVDDVTQGDDGITLGQAGGLSSNS